MIIEEYKKNNGKGNSLPDLNFWNDPPVHRRRSRRKEDQLNINSRINTLPDGFDNYIDCDFIDCWIDYGATGLLAYLETGWIWSLTFLFVPFIYCLL